MATREQERIIGELERLLGADPRLFVTQATLQYLKDRVSAVRQSGAETLRSQAEAGMGTDSWHDEGYKALVQAGSITTAVLKVIEPLGGVDTFVSNAKIIKPNPESKIGLGSEVQIEVSTPGNNGHRDHETLTVVGPVDKSYAGPGNEQWVSCLSPVGLGLFGRRAGETFRVITPGGLNNYEIISVSPAKELQ